MTLTKITEGLERIFGQRHMASSTLGTYRTQWKRLREYLDDKYGNEDFDMARGMSYFKDTFKIRSDKLPEQLTKVQSHVLRVINTLEDFKLHGAITKERITRDKPIELPAALAESLSSYRKWLLKEGYAKKTIELDIWVAVRFLGFLQQIGRTSLTNLKTDDCEAFIKTWARYSAGTSRLFMRSLKFLLKYLFASSAIKEDIAPRLLTPRTPRHSPIPSSWTADEISKLLSSIDRNSPNGKRDYAMILLGCLLGLRSIDVANLKFSNFDWTGSKLRFTQHETGREIELPVPEDVIKAVADYAKNGRPRYFKTSVVFLKHRPPFDTFAAGNALSAMLERRRRDAGIPKSGKHWGFHSLRHAAACAYLEKETPLPVIAQILGHADLRTTSNYLKCDVDKLAECVLDPREFEDEEK
ncbi:MAG: tyrosine-type recombinase/integrase [Burkholderiales bacterium]|nr:tyrosine-type recombinase/integrase [Burkholderiales bacterium]